MSINGQGRLQSETLYLSNGKSYTFGGIGENVDKIILTLNGPNIVNGEISYITIKENSLLLNSGMLSGNTHYLEVSGYKNGVKVASAGFSISDDTEERINLIEGIQTIKNQDTESIITSRTGYSCNKYKLEFSPSEFTPSGSINNWHNEKINLATRGESSFRPPEFESTSECEVGAPQSTDPGMALCQGFTVNPEDKTKLDKYLGCFYLSKDMLNHVCYTSSKTNSTSLVKQKTIDVTDKSYNELLNIINSPTGCNGITQVYNPFPPPPQETTPPPTNSEEDCSEWNPDCNA